MGSLINLAKLWFAVVVGVARRLFRRLLLGPTMPSWTWRTDVTVAIAKAAVDYATQVPDDPWINAFGLKVRAPVPHELHGRVKIVSGRLGTHRTDEYIRLNEATDVATMLYLHGGAYVYGNPGTHRQHVARIVDRARLNAFAPTYRLAPAHPFPAGVEDAVEAYESLVASGVDPTRLIIAGDSAGGGLAMAVLLSIRDRGGPLPAGAVLFSPYADIAHEGLSPVINADSDYLPSSEFTAPNRFYTTIEQIREPLASPIHADLTGLPPLLILAGAAEMILDDSVRLNAAATRDGVDSTLSVYADMMHVWPAIVPWEPASTAALDEVATWVERTVGG